MDLNYHNKDTYADMQFLKLQIKDILQFVCVKDELWTLGLRVFSPKACQ